MSKLAIVLLLFPLLYLAYNFIVGIFLAFSYYQTEGQITNRKYFFWLLFLPSFSLGKWRYQQKIVDQEFNELPEQWYINKYKIKLHWGFLVSFALFVVVNNYIPFLNPGGGSDWANKADSTSLIGFGLLADLGIIIINIIILGIAIICFVILYMIFIIVPKSNMQGIENTLKIKKLMQMKQNQARQS